MATNNAVNSPLSGTTGTGNFAGSTSPTFVTPTLGAATASSLAFSPTTGGIIGTTAADNAAAGDVGEYIVAQVLVGSAVSLSNGIAATVTSIALTAGDWDIWGSVVTSPAGTTTTSFCYSSVSNVTNSTPGLGQNVLPVSLYQSSVIAGGQLALSSGVGRININTPTTYYLVAEAGFAVSTMAAYGFIAARRRR